jgi:predicted O-linked N-acetylglucosamine transferase (SPINDLY family)
MMGFTRGARPGIFSYRAAPVQVNFLGYPGTMGSNLMDYIIADPTVIPPGLENAYTEQVIRLPHCYLAFDDRRQRLQPVERLQAGLPEEALVYCAFTQPYKITPTLFSLWMELLRKTPDSVLWLRASSAAAHLNLTREAARCGVAAERLVFAPRVDDMGRHLGRLALADLYLDTHPYNGHSTVCDALWAGVPVVTCAGEGFASRVAASALKSVQLPELVASSLSDYESLALSLARDRTRLNILRKHLAEQRAHSPLFNTRLYTRHLESAFLEMHARRMRGDLPAAFDIAPMDCDA